MANSRFCRGKMAGLVDYGVDSEDDAIRGNSPKSGKITAPPSDNLVINSDNEKSSNKTEEVPKKSTKSADRDRSRHNKDKERHGKRRSRSKSRSRSRSRDRQNRKHKKKRSRDSDHHHADRKKRKSKSRSRSRSTSPRRNRRHVRQTRSQERRERKAAAIERMGLDVNSLAASVAMSASSTSTSNSSWKQESEKGVAMAAAQQVLQNQVEQVQKMTGVALPSFYNPGAVNPMKYAQQIQKRKLLWANKEKKETVPTTTAKIWEATAFNQDQDGKMTAKFKRMMGIKSEPVAGPSQPDGATECDDVLKKQQELFASLDQQYQVARATTHIQRGLGLGFSSNGSFPR